MELLSATGPMEHCVVSVRPSGEHRPRQTKGVVVTLT